MVRLGQRLKEERIRRKLTLEEVAIGTKIKRDFLAAIEQGSYDKLPSPAYAKGFAQNYADYLGLPRTQSAALFKRDFDEKRALKVLPDGMTNQDFPLKRFNIRQAILGLIGVLLIAGFLLFQYRSIFFTPQLDIKSPKEGAVVAQDFEISGQADANAVVTVNNEPVFVSSNGEFTKKISLFSGKTSFIVKAKNRFGKETILKRNVTVQ